MNNYQYSPYINAPQPQMQPPQPPPVYQQHMPVQNGGVMNVANEQEALNYLLAPGTSMLFKDINSNYIYERIRPYSQFEPTVFNKYIRVNEEVKPDVIEEPALNYISEKEFSELLNEVRGLKDEVRELKDKHHRPQWKPKPKEVHNNE